MFIDIRHRIDKIKSYLILNVFDKRKELFIGPIFICRKQNQMCSEEKQNCCASKIVKKNCSFNDSLIFHWPKQDDECLRYRSRHFLVEHRLSIQPYPSVTKENSLKRNLNEKR